MAETERARSKAVRRAKDSHFVAVAQRFHGTGIAGLADLRFLPRRVDIDLVNMPDIAGNKAE